MSINKIEMQDDKGNTYYPHTDASIVKYGDSDVGTALSELMYEKGSRIITVGVGKNFPTIQMAIDSIGKYLIYPTTIDIEIDQGTYSEDVLISGFYGGGALLINNNKTATDVSINSIKVENCSCAIVMNRSKLLTTSGHGIILNNVTKFTINYIEVTGVTTASKSGVIIYDCPSVLISNSTISNRYGAIVGDENSKIHSSNNTGINNVFGLIVYKNTSIGKSGTQPAGTTAEFSSGGGVIR